jgi:probable F420-dependent oxidoreductase
MHLGAVFPQREVGTDVGAIRTFAQAVEEYGFKDIVIADHVLGNDPQYHTHPNQAAYDHHVVVHEPLVFLSFLAAITRSVGLSTGILVLPQRQTVLVAKQAAEIDVLSEGRLRLCFGIGWNEVEYEALGENFRTRGKRFDEQIRLLRSLWTTNPLDFHGAWHDVTHAGMNPAPVQCPIPIWLGASTVRPDGGSYSQASTQSPSPVGAPAETVLRRIGTLADGWTPSSLPTIEVVERVHAYAREAGRGGDLPLEGRIYTRGADEDNWAVQLRAWSDRGASRFLIDSRNGELQFPDGHLGVLQRVMTLATEL